MSIFVQPTVSHLRESELAFNDAELVLHFCSDSRLVFVIGAFRLGQLPVATTLGLGEVPGSWCMISDCLFLSAVRRVAPNSRFLAMEQVGQYLGIMNIGRRCDHGMNQFCAAVDPDMRLHPEVPLIPFARLTHLRITLLLLVLGGTWRADDAGVNDCTAGDLQPILVQILIHQMEQLVAEIVLLHQVTELADRGFVRHGLPAEVDTDKLSQRPGIVKGFLGSRIGQVEPMLDEVDAQHALDADWAPTGTLWLGIERLDDLSQFLPRNDGFHFLKELFLASFLPVLLESGIGKRILAHQILLLLATLPIMNQHWN